MSEQKASYRQIMKATSIFGGVQFINIIVNIAKTKVIAVLLGANGIGIIGLFNSAINLIFSISSLGLNQSAVKDISEAAGTNSDKKIRLAVTVLKKWVWLTGFFGVIIVLTLGKKLSLWSFGHVGYTTSFLILSIVLLLNSLNNGQKVVLQGLRKLTYLAKVNVIGSVLGLVLSSALYYWLKLEGIVPAIICISLVNLLLSFYYSHKVNIKPIKIALPEVYSKGIGMVKFGIAMTLSSFAASSTAYLIRAYISNSGNVAEVGFFQAGFVIINTYAGLVFTAMGTDYFPRVAAVNKNNEKVREIANHQADIAILIVGPLVVLLISFMPFVIQVLYSKSFYPVINYASWAVTGLIFKAASWTLSYIIIAKGEGKLFVLVEVCANSLVLISNIIGYRLYGLVGLGVSFIFTYCLYLLALLIITKRKYGFYYTKAFYKLLAFMSVLSTFALINSFELFSVPKHLFSLIIVVFTIGLSIIQLNKRLDILSLLKTKVFK